MISAKPVAFQNDTAVIQVIPTTGPNDSATTNLVNTMRGERTQLSGSSSIDLLVGGSTASNIDVSTKLTDALPIFLLVVVGLAFILLTFAFRTILVPITSILGFLLSIAAALGATVAVFQFGWGASLFGAAKSPVTLSYLPTILVAIIFGLSSDYEVFVVSRIKEEFTKQGNARRAVQRGTGVSVRVVSAAALIMFTIFAAFTTLNLSAVKPIAVSFAVGVLVDAFLVRLTLIPAAMAIIRAKLWYHPQWSRGTCPTRTSRAPSSRSGWPRSGFRPGRPGRPAATPEPVAAATSSRPPRAAAATSDSVRIMRIGLFVTCLTDTMFPETGKAVLTVLERLGHQVEFPAGQSCCGQMHFNTGYRREAVPMARGFTQAFEGYEAIVTPSASCAAMVREYHPVLAAEAGDAALDAGGRGRAEGARPGHVPDRGARRDRRGRSFPASGDVPPDLPLAADDARRRRPAAAAAGGGRHRPGRPA